LMRLKKRVNGTKVELLYIIPNGLNIGMGVLMSFKHHLIRRAMINNLERDPIIWYVGRWLCRPHHAAAHVTMREEKGYTDKRKKFYHDNLRSKQ